MYLLCVTLVFAPLILASSEDAQSKTFSIPWNNPSANIFQQLFNSILRPPGFTPSSLPSGPSRPSSSACLCLSSDFVSQAVSQHNCYRGQLHSSTSALTQNATLNTAAQNYANVLAGKISSQGTSALVHSPEAAVQNLYVENVALVPGCSNINGCSAVDAWYNLMRQNSFSSSNPYNLNTDHFTQVIWKDSSQIGIGKATTFTQGSCWTVVVANYLDPGNNPLTFSGNNPLTFSGNNPLTFSGNNPLTLSGNVLPK